MKRNIVLGAAAAVGAACGTAGAGEVSGNVALATDYAFRGISQSDEHPAIQGGLDFAHDSGLFLGTWASNVDFDDGDEASMELDVYGGFGGALANGVEWNVSAIYYAYPGADSGLNYDYWEFGPAVSVPVGPVTLSATLLWSPEFFADSGDALYSQVGAELPMGQFALGATYGYQDIDDNAAFGTPDYGNWSVYASTEIGGVGLSLTYHDTDLDSGECFGGTDLCDARAIFSISKAL